jgi:hypothetical protein
MNIGRFQNIERLEAKWQLLSCHLLSSIHKIRNVGHYNVVCYVACRVLILKCMLNESVYYIYLMKYTF